MYEKSIEYLNKAVADEMYAVNQYMYFHFHCEDQGYGQLAGLFFRTAVEEMDHIERCAERIIFLGGDVEMVAAEDVKKVQDVKKMLEQSRQMEQDSVKDYNGWANECSAAADAGSRQIFEGLVADEERHYSQYDDEVLKIEKFGERYLALQSMQGMSGAAEGEAH